MQYSQFETILNDTLSECARLLTSKAKEYADGKDRLVQFKSLAELLEETPAQVLGGMMAKHTGSIYQMINSKNRSTLEKWDEKILDHINYLILLRALVTEDWETFIQEQGANQA